NRRFCPVHVSAMFFDRLEFARQLWITDVIRVEVRNADAHTVLHLECADFVQERSPTFVFFQVLGYMTGKKDVPGVATIHYPLRHVDPGPSHIGAFVHVYHTTDWPVVNAHAHLQARVVLERAADLHRTLRWFLRALVENQPHAVAGGDL